jgi:hypothetical protein
MKISEVLNEGFWSGLGSAAGAVAKGVAKGAAEIVAPGAVDAMAQAKQQAGYNDVRKTSAYTKAQTDTALTSDPKIKAALDKTLADAINLIRQRLSSAQATPASKSSFDTWGKTTNPNPTRDPKAIKKLKKNNPMFYKKTLGEGSAIAEAEGTVPTITLPEIQQLLAKNGAPAEGAEYVASQLAASGVRVAGYQAPAGTVAAVVSKENRIVDLLIQRAKQNGKTSMAEISKAIPQTGQYADKAKHDAKIKEIAKKIAELNIPVDGYQLQARPDQYSWDSTSSTLSISNDAGTYTYRRLEDGSWRDNHTGEKIKPARAQELQYQFDKLTGRVAQPGGTPKPKRLQVNQVKIPSTGEILTKKEDGNWYAADGNSVVKDPKVLAWLERRYTLNRQNAQMAANTITNPSVAV